MGFQLPCNLKLVFSPDFWLPSTVCGRRFARFLFFKSSLAIGTIGKESLDAPQRKHHNCSGERNKCSEVSYIDHAKSHVSLRQNWKKFNDTEFRQLLQAYSKAIDFSNKVGWDQLPNLSTEVTRDLWNNPIDYQVPHEDADRTTPPDWCSTQVTSFHESFP